MNWPLTRPGAGVDYVWPPFYDPGHQLSDSELVSLRDSGFDFVRLTVDPAIFLQTTEPRLSQLYDILRANVTKVTKAGLDVIVDLHPVTQNPSYPPRGLVEGPDAPLFQEYRDMVGHFAGTLSSMDTQKVAFEIMNEPPTGWGDPASAAQWQTMAEDLFHAARNAAPDLTLIVSGAMGGSLEGLTQLDPHPFQNGPVYFTFHYYDPYIFTIYPNNKHSKIGPYLTQVPFPPRQETIEAANLKSVQLIMADKSLDAAAKTEMKTEVYAALLSYLHSGAGQATIQDDFQKVLDWAASNGVPPSSVLLGEFGVVRTYGPYHGASENDRTLWLRGVRTEAERRGFAWSIWAYKGPGGMAIVHDDNTRALDVPTLTALGLHDQSGARCDSQ